MTSLVVVWELPFGRPDFFVWSRVTSTHPHSNRRVPNALNHAVLFWNILKSGLNNFEWKPLNPAE